MGDDIVGNMTTSNIINPGAGWAYLVVVVALLLACIFCNGLILVVFILNHSVRNRTNNFVVSLACADLVVGVVSMPLWIANAAPQVSTSYYLTSIDLLCCSASIFSCALLSLERALKITCPYWYVNAVTTDRVKIVIGFGWIAASLVGCLSLTRGKNPNNIPYISFISLVIFVLPVLVIGISYLSIFFVARKHSQNIRRQSRRIVRECAPRMDSDARTAWRLGLFIVVFIICWTPVFITIWSNALLGNSALPVAFRVLTSTLPYLNAVINPFLYALQNPLFRRAIKRLLKSNKVSRITKSSSKRIETSTFHTNINNSPTISRPARKCSLISERREDVLFLLKRNSCQESYKELLPLPKSRKTGQTLMKDKSRQHMNMWETSV